MLQKKICLLGAFSVGKTSLIKRYVDSLFDDKYHTTVGVKIDKKQLTINNTDVNLMIWDVAGKDDFTEIRSAYLRGLSGYIIVIDGTRSNTFQAAIAIYQQVSENIGDLPVIFVLNKKDVKEQWVLDESQLDFLYDLGHPIIETSAKTGQDVDMVFMQLAQDMLAGVPA